MPTRYNEEGIVAVHFLNLYVEMEGWRKCYEEHCVNPKLVRVRRRINSSFKTMGQ
jgi:hypothetical protein